MEGPGALTVLLGASAGALVALGGREALLATPALAGWLRGAVEPLARAGREGYLPSQPERRRLVLLGTGAVLFGGLVVAGPATAAVLTLAGPGAVGAAISRRHARFRRSVERSLPDIAHAVADSLSAGRSLRGSFAVADASLDGPAAAEMGRIRSELELGSSTAEALAGLRRRIGSPRVDAFCAAVLSQQLAGGDLAGLLRRFAEAAAERDRVSDDARVATAQARFTGLLVVAMPSGAALFAELIEPGFLSRLLADPVSLMLLTAAALLQGTGFYAIRRLSRIAS